MIDASNDIAGVIKAQINLVKSYKIDAADGWKEIRAVLRKYEPWGGMSIKTLTTCHIQFWNAIGD